CQLRSANPVATAAVWALVAIGLIIGMLPAAVLGSGDDIVGDSSSVLVLQCVAVGLGGAAALMAWRKTPAREPEPDARLQVDVGSLTYSDDRGDVAVVLGLAGLIALGTLGAVGYLTFEGLSYGFLPPANF
ncbi:MAG: hypothetical protein ACRDJ0_05680, partial [Actinomycetota bacterium]